ncbi:hypothetical protein FHS18_006163 [Paenibacillus phyllosphaerae]|uniref:Uncharacterized protein n=1 Tax=Paenibacillus phyllosphaerae TaxID=274593 RepID=A0A7W5B4E7_9BACL|nr:hypothetical protein [Paenibacillus phyllosphaerae]MBB3114047.1 hypothetical protein [Paenibacillus phyllosphaerae]
MKQLPLYDPRIYGRMYYSFPLSIIANEEGFENWFYSSFIQLQSSDVTETLARGVADYRFFYVSSPLCYEQVLDIEAYPFEAFSEGITKFIEDAVDTGKYVYAYVDKYYVSDNPFFQKRHYMQETLIHGYDRESRTFSIIGFNKQRLFAPSVVPYADIANGIRHVDWNQSAPLFLLRAKKRAHTPFRPDEVYLLLDEYLQASNSCSRIGSPERSEGLVFGMDTYEALAFSLQRLLEDKAPIVTNIASLHVLWEHKKMMLRRLEYMCANNIIPPDSSRADQWGQIINLVDLCKRRLMKFEFKGDPGLIGQIVADLSSIRQREEALLRKELPFIKLGGT